jgi:hypothetical protein
MWVDTIIKFELITETIGETMFYVGSVISGAAAISSVTVVFSRKR